MNSIKKIFISKENILLTFVWVFIFLGIFLNFEIKRTQASDSTNFFDDCKMVCQQDNEDSQIGYQSCVREDCSQSYGCENEEQACTTEYDGEGSCKISDNRLLWLCETESQTFEIESSIEPNSEPLNNTSSVNSNVNIPQGCNEGFEDLNGFCLPTSTGLSDKSIAELLGVFMLWLLSIFGVLSVIALIISGIQYVTSTGDEGRIETAKRNMKWSIVGMVIGLSGVIIIKAVASLLS